MKQESKHTTQSFAKEEKGEWVEHKILSKWKQTRVFIWISLSLGLLFTTFGIFNSYSPQQVIKADFHSAQISSLGDSIVAVGSHPDFPELGIIQYSMDSGGTWQYYINDSLPRLNSVAVWWEKSKMIVVGDKGTILISQKSLFDFKRVHLKLKDEVMMDHLTQIDMDWWTGQGLIASSSGILKTIDTGKTWLPVSVWKRTNDTIDHEKTLTPEASLYKPIHKGVLDELMSLFVSRSFAGEEENLTVQSDVPKQFTNSGRQGLPSQFVIDTNRIAMRQFDMNWFGDDFWFDMNSIGVACDSFGNAYITHNSGNDWYHVIQSSNLWDTDGSHLDSIYHVSVSDSNDILLLGKSTKGLLSTGLGKYEVFGGIDTLLLVEDLSEHVSSSTFSLSWTYGYHDQRYITFCNKDSIVNLWYDPDPIFPGHYQEPSMHGYDGDFKNIVNSEFGYQSFIVGNKGSLVRKHNGVYGTEYEVLESYIVPKVLKSKLLSTPAFVAILGVLLIILLVLFRRLSTLKQSYLDSLKREVYNDDPLSLNSDRPVDKDSLGFAPTVRKLVELIASEEVKPPVHVAINGKWGSGKSSFLMQVKKQLEEISLTNSKVYVTTWFNIWHLESEKDLLVTFLNNIYSAFDGRSKLRFRLKIFLSHIKKSNLFVATLFWFGLFSIVPVSIFLILGLLDGLGILSPIRDIMDVVLINNKVTETIRISYNQFSEFLKYQMNHSKVDPNHFVITILQSLGLAGSVLLSIWKIVGSELFSLSNMMKPKWSDIRSLKSDIGIREKYKVDFGRIIEAGINQNFELVVFIDDLDRVSGDKIRDLLSAINFISDTASMHKDLNKNLPIYFISAMDSQMVVHNLNSELDDDDDDQLGPQYLRKLFDLTVQVPVISKEKLNTILSRNYE